MNYRTFLHRRLLLTALLSIPALQLSAQAPAESKPPTTATAEAKPDSALQMPALQAAYKTSMDAVVADREKWLSALDTWYQGGLASSLKERAKSGDLDGAFAVKAEQARLAAHGEMKPEQLEPMPAGLRTLRGTYEATLQKVLDEVAKRTAAAGQKYLASLEALQKSLTMQREIDQAILVKTERERFTSHTEISANPPAPMAQAAPPAPPAAAEGDEYVTTLVPPHPETPVVLKRSDRVATETKFQPPVEITVVAKTANTNLRMGYAADQIIFNWERDPSELRVDGGPAHLKHKPGAGTIPKDTYVTIRWRVTPGKQTIFVDGELRYEHVGDYSKINNPVSVFTNRSVVTLKSLKVLPLPAGSE